MLVAPGCTGAFELPINLGPGVFETFKRIPFQGPQDAFRVPDERCHDCNVERGEIHHRRCDAETCPRCGGQLISCDCEAPAEHKLTESQWKELMDNE
jgi:hypothetical protein